MPVITKITTQQKSTDRYNVFWDDGKGEKFGFSVDEDVLIKFQLKKGVELDELTLMEIQYSDDIRKAYNSAITYLARRIRSEKEIKDYLIKKETEEPVINEVLHKLKSQNYLNDQDYAAAYVRTQINTTDKGPDIIRMELKEKGIHKDFFEKWLDEFSLEQQLEKAKKLGEKFLEKNTRDSARVQKQKLENLLLRKGYGFEIIHAAIEDLETNGDAGTSDDLDAIRYQGEKAHRKYVRFSGYEYEQKMKQALYRKGFSMDLIEQFLEEKRQS